MKIKCKWMDLIEREIDSSLTQEVIISRNPTKEGIDLVITVRQLAAIELYGLPEMRDVD